VRHYVSSGEFRKHQVGPKASSRPRADSTLHTGGNNNSAGRFNQLEGLIMHISINTWDSTGEIYELGLMAAMSPDFAETMIQRLMEEAAASGAPAIVEPVPAAA
jgi:hypothetical protein